MKKTRLFIFITALLITLLMVVGCDVSPVLTNSIPEGCVEASVMVSSSRDLEFYVNGRDTPLDGISEISKVVHFYYTLEPLWTVDDPLEKPYGEVTVWDSQPLPDDGKLGWVTPGRWKVSIYGLNSQGVIAFFGEQTVYFSSKNDSAVVYIQAYGNKSSLSIELEQPMYSKNEYEYSYVYSLSDCSGAVVSEDMLSYSAINNTTDNRLENGSYAASLTDINPGSYSLTIRIYRNENNDGSLTLSAIKQGTMVGGITKGLFFCDGLSLLMKGSIEPSDYTLGNIEVTGLCLAGAVSVKEGELKIGSQIVFSLDDQTDTDKTKYSISYQWYVNGNIITGETGTTLSRSFNTYGPKEVACVMVYKNLADGNKVYNLTVKDTFTITP